MFKIKPTDKCQMSFHVSWKPASVNKPSLRYAAIYQWYRPKQQF